jgi:hypothetical protein
MLGTMLAKTLYIAFGVIYLAAGITVLLYGTGVLPETVKKELLEVADGNLTALHISQEFSTLLVFTGLITLWFAGHYRQSLFFHWAMTLFWGLFAFVHWFDVHGQFNFDIGVLITAIPFFLFLFVGTITIKRDPQPRAV